MFVRLLIHSVVHIECCIPYDLYLNGGCIMSQCVSQRFTERGIIQNNV